MVIVHATGVHGAAKFSNGKSIVAWPDQAGKMHALDTSQFIALAEAVIHYAEALSAAVAAVSAGHDWAPPTATVVIP